MIAIKANRLLVVSTLSAFLAVPWAQGDVRLPAILSDHMVLQRDTVVVVWGWADAGEEVAVSIAGQIKITRLSLWARANVCGEKISWSGPLPAGHTVKGSEVALRIAHTDGGLIAKDGALRGFEVAGPDKQWKPAVARIEKDSVVVTSAEVKSPVAARYAWNFNPDGNLFNSAGLPASPFRTDAFPD